MIRAQWLYKKANEALQKRKLAAHILRRILQQARRKIKRLKKEKKKKKKTKGEAKGIEDKKANGVEKGVEKGDRRTLLCKTGESSAVTEGNEREPRHT